MSTVRDIRWRAIVSVVVAYIFLTTYGYVTGFFGV
jgi:hypothetical protein